MQRVEFPPTWSWMLEDNCCNPTKTRGVPEQIPSTHSQNLLAQHYLKQGTEKLNRNEHSGKDNTNTAVAVVRICLPHALHRLNSPRMDTSGQEMKWKWKCVIFKWYSSEKLITLNILHEVVPTWYSFHSWVDWSNADKVSCSRKQHTAAGVRTVYLCFQNRHSRQPTNRGDD